MVYNLTVYDIHISFYVLQQKSKLPYTTQLIHQRKGIGFLHNKHNPPLRRIIFKIVIPYTSEIVITFR